MGIVEKDAKKKRIYRNVQGIVLGVIGVAGILAVTMIAPNVFQAIPKLMGDKYKFAYRAKTVAGRLAQKGLVRFVERHGKKFVEITEKGRCQLLFEEQRALLGHHRPLRWDKRWRLVMFDIPEKRRKVRDRLRGYMHQFGFLRLQDSAWIFPYDCEDVVALVKAELSTGSSVLYAVIESIENDSWIKKHFSLK
ncbi:MAG: CRISPR-associated endonuclease Cas2 [Patescibacteria group bacterium]